MMHFDFSKWCFHFHFQRGIFRVNKNLTFPFYLIIIDSMTQQCSVHHKLEVVSFGEKKKLEDSILLNAHMYSETWQGRFLYFLPNKSPPLWSDVALWRLDEPTHDDTPQSSVHIMIHLYNSYVIYSE